MTCVIGAALVLVAAAAADADTIYTCTGGDYQFATPPLTDAERITATFIFATPLAFVILHDQRRCASAFAV